MVYYSWSYPSEASLNIIWTAVESGGYIGGFKNPDGIKYISNYMILFLVPIVVLWMEWITKYLIGIWVSRLNEISQEGNATS